MRNQEILAERARLLARPETEVDDADHRLVLLVFTVGSRTYAVEVDHVREVLARAEVSRLPWSPPVIAGVTNVRGEIVPVADAARMLRHGEASPDGPVLVLDGDGQPLGLRVDTVDDVAVIPAKALVAPEGDAARAAGDLVLGLTAAAVVLDARALHTDPRLTNHPQEGA